MTPGPLPPWPEPPPQHGAVVLRRGDARDLEMVQSLATDPYVPAIGTLPLNATKSQAEEWLARQEQKYHEGRAFSFVVARAHTDEALGHCGLIMTTAAAGRAQLGYAISPRHRGHGYGHQAVCALTAFAWSIPTLHRLEAYVEPWNDASIRTLERSGFDREGLLRSHHEIAGSRRDMALYAAVRQPGAVDAVG